MKKRKRDWPGVTFTEKKTTKREKKGEDPKERKG